jgi:hypothetical protein
VIMVRARIAACTRPIMVMDAWTSWTVEGWSGWMKDEARVVNEGAEGKRDSSLIDRIIWRIKPGFIAQTVRFFQFGTRFCREGGFFNLLVLLWRALTKPSV